MPHAEDLAPTHAVEGLQDGIALDVDEGVERAGLACDQRRRRELGKFEHRELLGVVAQRLRPVEDARTFGHGAVEQPGRRHVFDVERRVLAHDDRREIAQRHDVARDLDAPLVVIGEQFEMYRLGADAVQRGPVDTRLLDRPDGVTGVLCGAHHGNARVLVGLQRIQRVDNESKAHERNSWWCRSKMEPTVYTSADAVRSSSSDAASNARRATTP